MTFSRCPAGGEGISRLQRGSSMWTEAAYLVTINDGHSKAASLQEDAGVVKLVAWTLVHWQLAIPAVLALLRETKPRLQGSQAATSRRRRPLAATPYSKSRPPVIPYRMVLNWEPLYLRHARHYYCFVYNHCILLLKSILPDLNIN